YKSDTTAGGGSNLTSAASVEKTDGDFGDAIALSMKYSTKMDSFLVGVSGGYQTLRADAEDGTDRDVRVASVRGGFGGITLGGSYKDDHLGHDAQDQTVYNFGVKYAAGDMTFGGGVVMSTTETEADGTKTETEQTNASVSMTYKIGPGIKVGGAVQYEDNDSQDDKAYGVVVGLGLSY
ncbi:MAG: porin, partial [Pseudomonadota bacterium]|nr:porin [Pseudomonadota bacterium]